MWAHCYLAKDCKPRFFHRYRNGAAALFIIFPVAAFCSNHNELLGKIFDNN